MTINDTEIGFDDLTITVENPYSFIAAYSVDEIGWSISSSACYFALSYFF